MRKVCIGLSNGNTGRNVDLHAFCSHSYEPFFHYEIVEIDGWDAVNKRLLFSQVYEKEVE